jgi:DNA-binding GntR family transcriptional regulator
MKISSTDQIQPESGARTPMAREKSSISEQAYQYLRSLILAQELGSGEIFTERRLADQINASRTPLRTAIIRLEGEGLIERLANGSIVIRQVPVEELLEIILIRRLLEGEAAAQCAQRASPEKIAAMMAQTQALLSDPNVEFDPFWSYDDSFHMFIAESSGKPLLAHMIQNLRDKARMCHMVRMEKNFTQQAHEHISVLQALENRNAEEARTAMTNHIDRVRERLLKWLLDQ